MALNLALVLALIDSNFAYLIENIGPYTASGTHSHIDDGSKPHSSTNGMSKVSENLLCTL